MKIGKTIANIAAIVFAVLGLLKYISVDIYIPLMLLCLGIYWLLMSIEHRKQKSFIPFVLLTVFCFTIVIYVVIK